MVEWEVVSVTPSTTSYPDTCAVQNVCPSVKDTTLTIDDGLVEVETVQVGCHGGDTKCSEPDTDNRPPRGRSARTGVVEGVLEDQTTEVAMSNDVIGLFFLTELVTVVLGLSFSGFTNQ